MPDIVLATSVLAALFVLGLFDVWLPHGDNIDVGTAVVIPALLLTGALPTLVLAAAARVGAHLLRYRLGRLDALASVLARRSAAVALAAVLMQVLGMGPGDATTFASQALVGVAVVAGDLVVGQLAAAARLRQPFTRLILGNTKIQGPLAAAQVSLGVLTAQLHAVVGAWGLVIVIILLLAVRQSFSLLLDIRQAYGATIEALAATIEKCVPERSGHAQRVARLARLVGSGIGIYGDALERLGYAALLHDIELLGADDSVIEGEQGDARRTSASEVLTGVGTLRDVSLILALCDGMVNAEGASHSDRMLAYIVCRASNLDDKLLSPEEWLKARAYGEERMDALLPARERVRIDREFGAILAERASKGTK